ncbi:hypothetical protein Csa_022543, partial [Cucumis sativus]
KENGGGKRKVGEVEKTKVKREKGQWRRCFGRWRWDLPAILIIQTLTEIERYGK